MKVYLDNAATTPMAPEVLEAMMPFFTTHFGNPSSTHQFGRTVKSAVETARKSIARQLNCSPMEICFTSGGTEADNMAINGAVSQLGVRHIISSEVEHHAVLHTVAHCHTDRDIRISMVDLDKQGHVNIAHLRKLLADSEEKTLVSLMHANNEIGTMIDLDEIGDICAEYGALFHSDTVQTMGHFKLDMAKTKVHFITGAAHKFHGPKGVGFLYLSKDVHIEPLIRGGSQERNMRAGTENIYGIVGMAKALEMACADIEGHQKYVQGLKDYMKKQLCEKVRNVTVNGCEDRSLYTVLNVKLPPTDNASMLLFLMDIDGIACSGGSACSSGSNQGSHVLRALHVDQKSPNVRFSFSRYTTREEIDYAVERLVHHLNPIPVMH
ncbi:cysteine desulfurase [Cryomorpha ignava]|uniref:cysteine desulfurase n=1 Tax=Cryomorpha ignava TaxID=101383 RepID=A0A7K3WNA7_9FLAO|nr:cysteine desulfurase family protein [Cryomorpha ignava]NEN23130.1 cysteine desulfurase [Cryomorpha ignava]